MFFELGQMDVAIKAAKKLAFDTGFPQFVYGSTDKQQAGYNVGPKLPPGTKSWSRFWPDGAVDNHRNPRH